MYKKYPLSDGRKNKPIVQPLAPCRMVGCCAVNGAVPRALFMVTPVYQYLCEKSRPVGEVKISTHQDPGQRPGVTCAKKAKSKG